MLFLDGQLFAGGRSRFLDQQKPANEPTAKIFVPIRLGGIDVLAQLDTGAPWSILNNELADNLGLLAASGQQITLTTRVGPITGTLERTAIIIVASEGDSLEVEATVFVSPDWREDNFLGWSGLLERLRIALDPSENENHFYFGATVP